MGETILSGQVCHAIVASMRCCFFAPTLFAKIKLLPYNNKFNWCAQRASCYSCSITKMRHEILFEFDGFGNLTEWPINSRIN